MPSNSAAAAPVAGNRPGNMARIHVALASRRRTEVPDSRGRSLAILRGQPDREPNPTSVAAGTRSLSRLAGPFRPSAVVGEVGHDGRAIFGPDDEPGQAKSCDLLRSATTRRRQPNFIGLPARRQPCTDGPNGSGTFLPRRATRFAGKVAPKNLQLRVFEHLCCVSVPETPSLLPKKHKPMV